MKLPQPVAEDLTEVLVYLEAFGWVSVSCRYDPQVFGNYTVAFAGSIETIEITRDRGQYLLGGAIDRLKALSLWQAFQSTGDLLVAIRAYLGTVA